MSVKGRVRPAHVDDGLVCREHDLVHRSLRRAERPVDREGPGHVGGEVPVLGAGIDEQQVAIGQRRGVLDVVQDDGVVAAGHDRAVADALRIELREDVLQHRLQLPLGPARCGEAHGFEVGDGTDAAGLPERIDLGGRLDQPQLVEDRADIHERVGHRSPERSAYRRAERSAPRTSASTGPPST